MPFIARLQPLEIGFCAQAPGHQLLHFCADIIAISLAIALTLASLLGFRRIVGFKRLAVSLDLLVQLRDLFGELPARENALLAGVAVEQGAVDRNKGSADKAEFANEQHETAVRRLQGFPVLLAEVGDRPVAGL